MNIDPPRMANDPRDDEIPERRPLPLTNVRTVIVDGEKVTQPLPMSDIVRRVYRMTGGWPRRVGQSLFVHDGDRIDWLHSSDGLFGYIGTRTGCPAVMRKSEGCHSRGEIFCEHQRTATAYDGISDVPHFPPLDRHYYACDIPDAGDGKALQALIDRLSPETPDDRQLILAMIVTQLWGGPAGTRPAFVITSDSGRGVGKTTCGTLCSSIAGGCVSIEKGEDISKLKSRLLSPEGRRKPTALIDNVKGNFSWAELESLVTATDISGHQLYAGEGRRPNVINWIVTLNGPSMSEDFAQRSVVIKLARPTYSASWLEDTQAFIAENRQAIIADVAAFFQRPAQSLDSYTRWQTWESAVLSRLDNPAAVQRLIIERQGEVNAEREESSVIEDHFCDRLSQLGIDTDRERAAIPTGIAAKWMSEALGEKVGSVAGGRRLRAMIRESSVRRIAESRLHGKARGVTWWPVDADESVPPINDLEERIASFAKPL